MGEIKPRLSHSNEIVDRFELIFPHKLNLFSS